MIPSGKDVEQARALLGRYLRPTRLVSAESLAGRSGARVYLKIESDLPTGPFTLRGALEDSSPEEQAKRWKEFQR